MSNIEVNEQFNLILHQIQLLKEAYECGVQEAQESLECAKTDINTELAQLYFDLGQLRAMYEKKEAKECADKNTDIKIHHKGLCANVYPLDGLKECELCLSRNK